MDDEIRAIEDQITKLKSKLTEARRQRKPEPVAAYRFQTGDGTVSLSDLFGEHDDLLVIHNMGSSCPYCTLWADGINGLLQHIENRTACVLVSPDAPDIQARFAAGRGWKFQMLSDGDGDFTQTMGFRLPDKSYYPGVSALKRCATGEMERTGSTFFGPGDDFCAVWPLFDLLDGGVGEWEPRYRYATGPS